MRKNNFVLFCVILLLTIAVLYVSFDRLFIYFFAKTHNLEISYKRLFTVYTGRLIYGNVTVLDRKTGLGFFLEEVTLKPKWDKALAIDFKARQVRFIKKENQRPRETYDTLTGLISVPFDSRWVYKEISGAVSPFQGGVAVKNFIASSDSLKLSITGEFYNNYTIRTDVIICFSNAITSRVPEGLTKTVLNDEKDGWKSLSVHMEGNYKEPSIQVSSKRFRLNIKTIVQPKS